jgi:hypothetical protein
LVYDGFSDFLSLDKETRAHALVGSFLQTWAVMEGKLDATIAEALGIHSLQELILCKNVQLSARIHILRTLVSISTLQETEKQRINKILNKLSEQYVNYRNIVAHNLFVPSETSDGVEFVVVRARSKLNFPKNDWSVAKFEEIQEEIGEFSNELESLRENLKISSAVMKEWAASFYADNPSP